MLRLVHGNKKPCDGGGLCPDAQSDQRQDERDCMLSMAFHGIFRGSGELARPVPGAYSKHLAHDTPLPGLRRGADSGDTPMGNPAKSSGQSIVLMIIVVAEAVATPILDADLESRLAVTDPADFIPVRVNLREQLDTRLLNAELRAAGLELEDRHRELMTALQEYAAYAQAPYLALLRQEEALGQLSGIVPLWISNAVELNATPAGVARLMEIFDDAVMYLDQVFLHEPVEESYGLPRSAAETREWGLEQIHAPALWEMGIFGQGTIVANLDTGVDGDHVALIDRWRGNEDGVEWDHAWLAEDGSQFPFDHGSHGTHTMGTMVGSVVGDTVGVAPAAQWIAARIGLQGSPGVNIGSAMQWCADPDGDPGTTDDVPDAVNNSWGGGFGCSSQYWNDIDNMELVGPVAAFSAGNEGPGSETIGAPSNRATTHVQNFSIGATNSSELVAGFSSRGPTKCNVADSLLFKPDVVAPGASVRSSIPNNAYGTFSGTSMSCPHVGGAISLLRQIMPALPPQELKTLLYRTARHPTVPGSEDNKYGRGIIDVEAAAQYLFDEFDLDGRIEGAVTDLNTGLPLPTARVKALDALLAKYPEVDGSYAFHLLAGDQTLVVSLWGYYPDTTEISVPGGGMVTHDVALRELPEGTVSGTLTNSTGSGIAALLRFYEESTDTLVASIQTDPDGAFAQQLKIGSYEIVVEPSPPEAFYALEGVAVDSAAVVDLTSTVPVADVLLVDADGDNADYADYFLNAVVAAGRSYNSWDRAWRGSADLAVSVMPATSKIVWFSGDATSDIISGDEEDALVAMLQGGGRFFLSGQNIIESIDGGVLTTHIGIGHEGNTVEHYISTVAGTPLGDAIDGDIFTTGPEPPVNQNSQDLLSSGVAGAHYGGVEGDRALVSWDAGGALAVIAGFGLEGVHDDFPGSASREEVMSAVLDYLDGLVGIEEEGTLPGPVRRSRLSQNHPNPFNPSTFIRFALAHAGDVLLAVYDARGNRIATLVDGPRDAGHHAIRWNGQNQSGLPVASGVYFYRLETGNWESTRRMVLVK